MANERPYFCCGNLPSEGHKTVCQSDDAADQRLDRRMPPCSCGHGWPLHVIPGGLENIDVYPHERHCVDCGCRNYNSRDRGRVRGR